MSIVRFLIENEVILGVTNAIGDTPANAYDIDIPVVISDISNFSNSEFSAIYSHIENKKIDANGNITDMLVTDYDIDNLINENIAVLLSGDMDTIEIDIDASIVAAMSVPQLKKYKSGQANARYSHAMNWILNSYDQNEINSWSEQKIDAENWTNYIAANPSITDADADYNVSDMLKELAKGAYNKTDATLTIADMNNYRDRIVSKSSFYRPYSGGLTGVKNGHLSTISSVLDDFSNEPLPQQAEDEAKATLISIDTTDVLAAGYAYIAGV